MIEVELPDGTIAEVETDDENVARATAQRYWDQQQQRQPPAAAPAGPPQPPIPGASRAEVERLNAQTPQTGGPPSSIMRAGREFMGRVGAPVVQSVGRIAADSAGMLPDAVAGIANAVPAAVEMATGPLGANGQPARIRRPIGGSEFWRDTGTTMADALGMPLQDQNALPPQQRFAQRAAEEAGTSIIGGQILRGLSRMARGPATPTTGAPSAPTALERPYMDAPARAVVTDAAAGAGVATGIDLAQSAGFDSPVARVISGFLGGLGGATLPALATDGTRAARMAARLYTPDRQTGVDPETAMPSSRGVADEAARIAQGNTVDPPRQVADIIREAIDTYRGTGMPVPTTGIASNDEGLLALERGFRASTPRIVRRDRQVAEAATDQVRRTAPADAPAEPAARAAVRDRAGDTVRSQVAGERAAVESYETGARRAERAAIEAEADEAARITQRAETGPQAAQRFDSALVDETMRPMQAEQRRLYDAIPDTPASVDDLRAVVQAIRDRTPRTVPEGQAQPTAWLDRLESLETVSIRDLNEMRPFIDTAQRQARTAGDFQLADNYGRLRRHIDEQTDRLAASSQPGAAEAQAARAYSRDEIAPRFGRTSPEMADLRRRVNQDPENRSAAPREDTARTFLGAQPDTPEGALHGQRLTEQVRRALAGQPSEAAGRAAARDYVMASMRGVVGRDGRVSLAAFDEWMRQHASTIRGLPEIDQEVTAMRRDLVNRRTATTEMQRQLEDATALRGRTEREIQDSAASLFLERDTPRAVAAIFESGDPRRSMRQVVTRLRNQPDAMRGLRTAVADYLEARVTTANTAATTDGANPTSLARLGDLFREHRGTLEILYGPGSREMQALQNAHRAVSDMARLTVRGVAGSETGSLADQIGRLAERALRLPAPVGFGAVTGGMLARNVKMALGSIPGLNNDAAIRRLLQRMQTEPELAVHLLTRDVPPARQRAWNRRLTELLAIQEGVQPAEN